MVSDEQILKASVGAKSITEIMRRLGLKPNGYAHARFKKRVHALGIKGLKGFAWNKGIKSYGKPLSSYLVKSGPIITTSKLRKRLLREKLIENKCDLCGLFPEWNGKELTLQLDHIDGDRSNNCLDNLRILCPNCHTQTGTYAVRKS